MLQGSGDFDDNDDGNFPTFPVVFQQELNQSAQNFASSRKVQNANGKGHFKLPDKEIKELLELTQIIHHTSYPDLFTETWEAGQHSIQNFFQMYNPLNKSFVAEMKKIIDKLNIVRLSSHKIYIGQFSQGKCNGMGILIFKNGNIYEGAMKQNKRQGKGIYIQQGIGWFAGQFKNDLKSEQGTQVNYKKSAYKGNFLNGLRNNQGTYVDKQGNTYHGSWKLGIIHGKGILKAAASTYNGNFVNSLKHGSGQERFANGDSYKGEYQNNRFDGFGSYSWKEDGANYEGSFKNGMRHGKGKWQAGQTKYSGGYSQGLKQGYGELYFPSGNFYKGNFIEDKREGYGQMFWTDGSFYKGDWKGGIQNGKGQIYLIGGEVISGLFQNSILVQIMPTIYEKQMEISNMGIHAMFGSQKNIQNPHKMRTTSESKHFHHKKRLAKIDERTVSKRNAPKVIKDNLYFKSPQKSDLSKSKSKEGGECLRCVKRLENFRLKNQTKPKLGDSIVHNHDH